MKYISTAEFCTLWAAHAIGRLLRAGVTSIAVPGGKWFTDVTVREAVEGGLLESPRMVVAGRALSNYSGISDPDPFPAFQGTPADTAGVLRNTRDEFIRETRKQWRRGVDLTKIADSTWGDVQTVADDEIGAVVDEAHRDNVKVIIHSRGSTSTRAAAKAGIDLIYHADLATPSDLNIIAKAGMPQPNDSSRSSVALDQNSTTRAVIEMSQSSWLVAGMLPGIERQPRKKLEPSPERLLALHRSRPLHSRGRLSGSIPFAL